MPTIPDLPAIVIAGVAGRPAYAMIFNRVSALIGELIPQRCKAASSVERPDDRYHP